jgi:hypothetical protein
VRFLFSPHYRRVSQALVGLLLSLYAGSALWLVPHLDSLGLDEFDGFTIRYAIALIIVQSGMQGLLVLGLVVTKHIRGVREAERTARLRKIGELLSQVGQASRPVHAPKARDAWVLETAAKWPDEFLAAIGAALQSLSGSAQQHVAGLLESSPAFERLLDQAAHPDPRRAIEAISMLARLENERARAAVREALRHSAEPVRRAARKAVMVGGDEQARRQVLDTVAGVPFWERIILFHLAPEDATLDAFLAEALASGRDPQILVALEFILTRERLAPIPVPVALAASVNIEVRIKFFRALPFLPVCPEGGESLVALLEAGLRDSDWRVRAQAARACGALRAAPLAPALFAMCGSFENPAEAGHAARALAALGGDAFRQLQSVAVRGEGAGSRIAAEVLERRLIGPEAKA